MLFFAFGSALTAAISHIWAYSREKCNYVQGDNILSVNNCV